MEIGQVKILKAFKEKGLENVVLWDVQNISDGQLIKFILKNTPHKQEIWIRTDKGIEIPELNREVYKSISLWEDTSPEELLLNIILTMAI